MRTESDRTRRDLRIDAVTKSYRARSAAGRVAAKLAVNEVSLSLAAGECLALIGQSGSGKSTLARLITGIERPTSGRIEFGEIQVSELSRRALRTYRKHVQLVFQDPYAALNPASKISYILTRPLVNYRGLSAKEAGEQVRELLTIVGLTPATQFESKLPHELSGGQRQRVVIARALACDPALIIADEPASMLDVSLRAGILELLTDLRVSKGISLLYITHDLLSARAIADDLVVLHNGRVIEQGPARQILQNPQAEYTRRLIEAVPNPFGGRSAEPPIEALSQGKTDGNKLAAMQSGPHRP